MLARNSFFQYVLECLECETDSQVKSEVLPFDPDNRTYAFLKTYPGKLKGVNQFLCLHNDPKIKAILEKASPEQSQTKYRRIVIGYPTLTMGRDKKRYVFPIVFWRVTDTAKGICKGPYIHSEFIAAFKRSNPDLTFFEFLKENGISVDLENLDSIASMVTELCKFPVTKKWRIESLDPRNPDTSDLDYERSYYAPKVHNRIIVAASQGPTYTAGLIEEIKEIQTRPYEEIQSTALGCFFDCLFNQKSIDPSQGFEDPILEDGRSLNADQRQAVRQALVSPVALIQGPPGTGKTQVVKNLYLNALMHGQKVLFTSKNTAAVEAVTGTNIKDEPLTLTQVKIEKQGAPSPTVIEILDEKINRIREFQLETIGQLKSIDSNYEELRRLQKRRQDVEKRASSIASILSKMRDCSQDHDDFAKQVPCASLVKESLYRGLCSTIENTLATLSEYEKEQRKPFSLRHFIVTYLNLYFLRKRLSQQVDRLYVHLQKAGLAQDVLSFWEDTPDLVQEELKKVSELLRKFPDFKKYEMYQDTLQTLGTFFDIDKALFEIDMACVKHSKSIIKLLPTLQHAQSCKKEWREWKRLCSDYKQREQALAKATDMIRCIAVKALSLKGRVPLKAGYFDLAIIDEAGQCDVFSMIPVLYRAKRIAVIGDPKQLNPIVNLDQYLFEQIKKTHWECSDIWPYTAATSFYTLAQRVNPCGEILLRDHYRCHPDISAFVSSHFDGGHLNDALMREPKKPVEGKAGIFWHDVNCDDDKSTDLPSHKEVVHVLNWVQKLIQEYGLSPDDIGVITPFREQTDSIVSELDKNGYGNVLVATAHGFQGGERQVIIYSLCLRRHLRETGKQFLSSGENLFNVALTRAKKQLVVVGDKEYALRSELALYRDFATYVENLSPSLQKRQRIGICESVSAIEMALAQEFEKEGIAFTQQEPVGRYVLDFSIKVGDSRLNLEVDGEKYHMTATGSLRYYDRLRNQYLIGEGWDVKRYWAREVKQHPEKIVAYVRNWIKTKERENNVVLEKN